MDKKKIEEEKKAFSKAFEAFMEDFSTDVAFTGFLLFVMILIVLVSGVQ